jgi:fatty acid desaturase
MSRRLQNLFGWIGFGPMMIPPEFWRRWHNVAHHAHTNLGDRDPDSFGTAHRYNKHPKLANFTKLAPGSGTWYSYFFLFYSFMFHAQLVLWMQTRRREEFKGFERNKAIRQALLCGAAWLVLAVLSGPLALFTVLIPLMMANALGQGYILTNHMLRPQMDNNHPVDNSMSVRQLRWLDPLHFHFSHHVEHHLFPKMGSDQAPKVRAWLQREMPDRYVCPSHARALVALYQTPRVYQDAHTLVDPLDRSRTVDVMALQGELR